MTPQSGRTVTVVGSANVDTTLRVPRLPGAGETILSSQQLVSPGGKGANQAAAAAWHGAEVSFVGATGTDPAAVTALANLRALGVDVAGVAALPGAATGSAVLLVAEDAENVIIVSPGANHALEPAHVARALSAGTARVLLTQLETPLSVLAECATHSEIPWRILNPAPTQLDGGFTAVLDRFNVLVPNRTELGQLARRPEPRTLQDVAECVAALGFGGTMIVTLGAAGAAVFTRGAHGAPDVIAPPAVAPVDTSGAGDVFCGVLAAELAAHDDVLRAARAAVAISAASTERRGAQLAASTELTVTL